MKRKIFAALLGAMLLVQPLTGAAAYESADEIALALRPTGTGDGLCTAAAQPNRIYISPEAAAEGTSVHMGLYIEAERAELCYISLWMITDSEDVTFVEDTYISPVDIIHDPAKTYTLPDGSSFASQFQPYCLGSVGRDGIFRPSMFDFASNFMKEENALRITWQNYGNATSFLGGASDAYSFTEFDMQIAPGTAPGVHTVGFNATDSLDRENRSKTYIESDESIPGKSIYVDLIPSLKPAQIVVTQRGDANLDGEVNASDAAAVLIYAAARGAGNTPSLTGLGGDAEELALRLADVSGSETAVHQPDASDAACILLYAALVGGGGTPDWEAIRGQK